MIRALVSVSRTRDEVAHRIRDLIQVGELTVGTRLPSQRTLAAELGVGRQAVQEALLMLESEGFITTRRGAQGGSFVQEPASRGELQSLLRTLDWPRIDDTYEFRIAIERQIALLAAERRTEDDLAAMRQAIADLPRRASTRAAFREPDGRFHNALAHAARNERLAAAMRRARADMFIPIDTLPIIDAIDDTRRQHTRILRAVERRDPAAAARAVVEHIEEARTFTHDMLKRELGDQ